MEDLKWRWRTQKWFRRCRARCWGVDEGMERTRHEDNEEAEQYMEEDFRAEEDHWLGAVKNWPPSRCNGQPRPTLTSMNIIMLTQSSQHHTNAIGTKPRGKLLSTLVHLGTHKYSWNYVYKASKASLCGQSPAKPPWPLLFSLFCLRVFCKQAAVWPFPFPISALSLLPSFLVYAPIFPLGQTHTRTSIYNEQPYSQCNGLVALMQPDSSSWVLNPRWPVTTSPLLNLYRCTHCGKCTQSIYRMYTKSPSQPGDIFVCVSVYGRLLDVAED